ncbi:ParA family protein [Candidatus Dependentiae bacterium]|nr:ParA family protein [Candidatus Dependentiae bacterium]
MRKIAIINQKGGSGKTTTTVNLAASLAQKKRKVLVIDLDPQASTSHWFDRIAVDKGLLSVFTEQVPLLSVITETAFKGVSIIPSSSWLIGLEKALASEVGAETLLKQKLAELDLKAWDYILVDCPPALGILTINALTACDEVLVPVEARIMAVNGLVQLLQTIDIVRHRLNNSLKIAGILPCRVDSRTRHSREVVEELRKNFSDLVYHTAIRENIRLAEAPSFFKPINEYDPSSNGALDYKALANEVIKQEKTVG